MKFFSKRASELPADETSGLTPDLATQNLYASLGVLDADPDPSNARHMAGVMFKATLEGNGPMARALIARIQRGSTIWLQHSQAAILGQAVHDLIYSRRCLLMLEGDGFAVPPANNWHIVSGAGGWQLNITSPDLNYTVQDIHINAIEQRRMLPLLLPGADPYKPPAKSSKLLQASNRLIRDLSLKASIRAIMSPDTGGKFNKKNFLSFMRKEGDDARLLPVETKQQINAIPPDRAGIDGQAKAALQMQDRDSGIPLHGLHDGVEMSRLTIDDQATRYAALLGQSLSRMADDQPITITIPATDIERRSRAISRLVKDEVISKETALELLGLMG